MHGCDGLGSGLWNSGRGDGAWNSRAWNAGPRCEIVTVPVAAPCVSPCAGLGLGIGAGVWGASALYAPFSLSYGGFGPGFYGQGLGAWF